jgi:hypothetical protein
MFAFLLERLGEWIGKAHERRRIDYLSCACDLAELERRMRAIERDGIRACSEREP